MLTPAHLHVGGSVAHHDNALVAELLGQAGERGGGRGGDGGEVSSCAQSQEGKAKEARAQR